MSAPAIDPNINSEPGFWAKPSTRLNIAQWLFPTTLAIAAFFLGLNAKVDAHTRDIGELKIQTTEFQKVKETRIGEMAVLTTTVQQQGKTLEEVKASQLRMEEKFDQFLQKFPR